MSNYNRSSGRRSRRGSRRRQGDEYRPQEHSGRREQQAQAPAQPAPKLGFWQSLWARLTGKKSQSQTSNGSQTPVYQSRSRSTTSAPAPTRPARKPEAVEVTSPKLYVGNLSFDATESDLTELFNGVGSVRTAEIVSHKQTERSKGFAFVTMSAIEEAKRAVDELHDKEFMGRKLVVSGAKTPERDTSNRE